MTTIDCTTGTRCEYCHSKTPDQGFTTKDVICRGSNRQTGRTEVQTRQYTVCKGSACGGNLQMSFEG